MASQKTHPLISTIMLRTLMDTRYFHGVRTAAADALVKHAKEGDMDWLGLFHLEKAFQHFFCYNDSPMPRPNDFLDRAAYFIQCAIPKAIAKVRDSHGKSPIKARMFLLDKLKFNDNSDNEVSPIFMHQRRMLIFTVLGLPLSGHTHGRIVRCNGFPTTSRPRFRQRLHLR